MRQGKLKAIQEYRMNLKFSVIMPEAYSAVLYSRNAHGMFFADITSSRYFLHYTQAYIHLFFSA